MRVGQLYTVSGVHDAPWDRCGPVLYLGEDTIERADGVRIVNHAVLIQGRRRLLDRSFLKFLKPLDAR